MSYEKSILRFVTTGSVDDGKSTLIGRLLYETNSIFEDQYKAVERTSERKGLDDVDLALLLDGLSAEREQGITIDVAYRYFSTSKRKFIIADTPGHEQYTRNMVTGASNSELAVILIDASQGVLTQSKRHGFLLSLLRIPHLVVAINKMDLVDYSQSRYAEIVEEYKKFSQKLEITDIKFVPVSALKGVNITSKSDKTPWYSGPSMLEILENVHVASDKNLIDFRFPVQYVSRPNADFRGFSGQVSSGSIKVGEEILVLPSGKTSTVTGIVTYDRELEEVFAGISCTLTLSDEIDISRGDMIVRKNNIPAIESVINANIFWMNEEQLNKNSFYYLKHTTRTVKVYINKIHYRIDVNTLHRENCETLGLNEVGRVEIESVKPLFFDSFSQNKSTGSFILIDPHTNLTVAGGTIKGRVDQNAVSKLNKSRRESPNVVWEKEVVQRKDWEKINGHKGAVIWFTGLSGAGKSTIARKLLSTLFAENLRVVSLDGDNVRHGLCGDLSFTAEDRTENIRRVGEVAKLFFEQGNIVLCTFISPYKKDRDMVRSIIPEGRFIEVFVKCSVDICKRRDPKGLYKKAELGEISNFTGVSSPYEEPETAEIVLETDVFSVDDSVSIIKKFLLERGLVSF